MITTTAYDLDHATASGPPCAPSDSEVGTACLQGRRADEGRRGGGRMQEARQTGRQDDQHEWRSPHVCGGRQPSVVC